MLDTTRNKCGHVSVVMIVGDAEREPPRIVEIDNNEIATTFISLSDFFCLPLFACFSFFFFSSIQLTSHFVIFVIHLFLFNAALATNRLCSKQQRSLCKRFLSKRHYSKHQRRFSQDQQRQRQRQRHHQLCRAKTRLSTLERRHSTR